MAHSVSSVRGVANTATRNATPRRGLEALARLGYFVKGVVYLIIGYFAVRVAIGVGGKTTDNRGALQTIYQEPFGQFLLIVTTIGLVGYGIWSLIRALMDPDGKGTDAKGVISRIGYAVVGVAYLSLAAGAARLLAGSGSSGKSSNASTQDWTAKFLQHSYGEALVILVGAIVIGVGLFLLYYAFSADFMQYFGSMGSTARTWTERLGRFGYAAQGVVFGEIGIFLIIAALRHNPHQAQGISGSLTQLSQQSYGHFLLAIVAIGLIAYGLYSWLQARYRRVAVS